MNLEEFKNKLKQYKEKDIIVTDHAIMRSDFRLIDLKDIKKNILNPEKLVYFKEKPAREFNKKKYECYFTYNELLHHKYVLVMNSKVIIVTIIIINRRLQNMLRR
jgi:hypothetical protein